MSISDEIRKCELCPLSKQLDTGFKPIPGAGNPKSKILFIYEALSQDDYLIQASLAGRNGLFFDRIIQKAGLSRQEIYTTTMLKCFASCQKEMNANVKTCSSWLDKQKTALNPLVIIPSGQTAIAYILKRPKTKIVVSEIIKTIITQDDKLIIPFPGLVTLLNSGNSIVDYHIDRLKKGKEWVSKVHNS